MNALCEILGQCNIRRYFIVYLDSDASSESASTTELNGNNASSAISNSSYTSCPLGISDPIRFHEEIKVRSFQCLDEVDKYYLDNIDLLKTQYGVLLFLYSVIASKVRQITKS